MNKKEEDLLERALDTLIWVTGSEDFARDGSGKASVGANKLLYPLIEDLLKHLGYNNEQSNRY